MNKQKHPSGGRRSKNSSAQPSSDKKNQGKKTNDRSGSNKPKKFFPKKEKIAKGGPMPKLNSDEIRLNKYLSNAGICSRREADVLIQSGVVAVNGKIVTEMGFKVKSSDKVTYDGEGVNPEKKRYVLLNKPKDFITTMDDPWGRKTVMSLVNKACKERVYPVGRLDRETTGLLLFTNDGDLAKKLTHPSHRVAKLYHVTLNNPVQQEDLNKFLKGIPLEDGITKADKIEIIEGKGNYEVGIEIHSGKNRIVRRMFEEVGYKVTKLDRVVFAGLTKKDLPRGHYRHLAENEIAFLRM